MTFFYLALLGAVCDWFAVARQARRLEYFAKPAVMIALLVWLAVNGGWQGPVLWFAAGFAFSLAGDVFLMLPREQFIAGLAAFLLGHLAYVAGFNQSLPQPNLLMAIWLAVVAALFSMIYRRIAAGVVASGKRTLQGPVLAYALTISAMLFSALNTLARPGEWNLAAALFASAGATLFFASDSLLAWNKFIRPLPHGRLWVIVTYHLGQAGIALGVALQFLPAAQ